eukprot:1231025-Prymnesium_polylepis.1
MASSSRPLVRVRVPMGVRGGDSVLLQDEYGMPAASVAVPQGMIAGDDFVARPLRADATAHKALSPVALSTPIAPCDHCSRLHVAQLVWIALASSAVDELCDEDKAMLAEPLPSTLLVRTLDFASLGSFEIHQHGQHFVWDAEVFLAHCVQRCGLVIPGSTVLELGAGTGLAGLVAARLGAQVVLSDMSDEALELCERNARVNRQVSSWQNVAAIRLEWGCAETAIAQRLGTHTPGLLLACEVLHREDYFPPLLAELQQRCGAHSAVLLAYDVRNVYREARFFELASRGFLVEPVPDAWLHSEHRCRNGKSNIVVMRPRAEVEALYELTGVAKR